MTQTSPEFYIEQGQIMALRRAILRLGEQRLGEPPAEVLAAISTLTDVHRLEQWHDRVWHISSWRGLKVQTIREAWIEEGLREGVKKGEIKGVRGLILHLGRKKLGEPPAEVVAALNGMTDMDRLESVLDRVGQVPDWQALLAEVAPSPPQAPTVSSRPDSTQE
jgi:hypothetical protein